MTNIQVVTPDQELDTMTWKAIQRFRFQLDRWDYACNKNTFAGYPELEMMDVRHPQSIEQMNKSRVEHGDIYLLAYDGINIVGFATISAYYSQPFAYWRFFHVSLPKVMTLDQICVDDSVRDGGIGSKLVDVAKQYSKSQGYRDMILGYMGGNHKAEKFYLKHKFRNMERFCVLRKPSGKMPHTPWSWSEVDGSSKIHFSQLTSLIEKYVDADCIGVPSMRLVASTTVDGILYEIKTKKVHVYGCNGGKDGYILCNTNESMLNIYFILFPDVMYKRPMDIIEAVQSVPGICDHEKWITVSVVQDKLDCALNTSGYRLYSAGLACQL